MTGRVEAAETYGMWLAAATVIGVALFNADSIAHWLLVAADRVVFKPLARWEARRQRKVVARSRRQHPDHTRVVR